MTFARPCALGCEQPIQSGQALLSVLELGPRGELVNRPVHFACFAESLADLVAERLVELLDKQEDSLDGLAASIVERLTRR